MYIVNTFKSVYVNINDRFILIDLPVSMFVFSGI